MDGAGEDGEADALEGVEGVGGWGEVGEVGGWGGGGGGGRALRFGFAHPDVEQLGHVGDVELGDLGLGGLFGF